MNDNRNIEILRKIIKYCAEIDEANKEFGNSIEILKAKSTYKNAVAMCILQIGELTTHLSDDFKATYSDMPWQDIKRMRNIAAHRYGAFDIDVLWDTVENDIPALYDYCDKIIKSYIASEEEDTNKPEESIG